MIDISDNIEHGDSKIEFLRGKCRDVSLLEVNSARERMIFEFSFGNFKHVRVKVDGGKALGDFG